MPSSAQNHHQGHLTTPRARNGEPQPAPTPASEPASAKRDLTSWWKQFSKRNVSKKEDEKEPEPRGIFGVPLITSIPYANVAISLFNENGESYIYGYVPIVVAKCGVFLKEKATDVEGIFRLAGSEKRIKELKAQFDAPPRWGKGLDWSGYTVHDAANILRRYFNQLPEPIIPLQYYDSFRKPLHGHQAEAVGQIEGQAPSTGGFDPDLVVHVYQQLIKSLPSLNRQLLLYILDLLAVFAAKADVNKMTTSNLSAIFQPGILSHPQHDMSPQAYRLSQDVLIFLIDNQDHFLIGMEGTAVDEGTAKHIESGPSTPQVRTPTTPSRNKSGLGRSASAASSAGAESVRKSGGVRRNVSTSSRQSRHSGAVPSPVAPQFASSSGVHRSNTVPSKRSPALNAARFPREGRSDPPTPGVEESRIQLPATTPEEVPMSKAKTKDPLKDVAKPVEEPIQPAKRAQTMPVEKLDAVKPKPPPLPEFAQLAVTTPGFDMPGAFPLPSPAVVPSTSDFFTPAASAQAAQALAPPPAPQPQRSPQGTPKHEKSEFMEGPIDSGTPVEFTPTVRTFTQILSNSSPASEEKSGRKPNKLQKKRIPSTNPSAHSSTHSLTGTQSGFDGPPSPFPPAPIPQSHPSGSKEAPQPFNNDTVSSRHSGATLKPSMSPSASFRSHSTATEYSEAEGLEEPPKEEKKSFWKSHKRVESRATPIASQQDLHGSLPGADKSMSSIGSSSGWGGGRKSLQYDSHQSSDLSVPYGESKEAGEKKSPLDWFSRKRLEHKERADKKQRAKSPPGSTSDMISPQSLMKPKDDLAVRGRSTEMPRPTGSQDSSDVTPTGPTPNPLAMTAPLGQPSAQSSTTSGPSTSLPAASQPLQPGTQSGTQPTMQPGTQPVVAPSAKADHPSPQAASSSPPEPTSQLPSMLGPFDPSTKTGVQVPAAPAASQAATTSERQPDALDKPST